ncbi:MAG: 16S rRNA processing protein RimM [Bacteroidales bacterium]|jgi:16S rRNA processing protein RimM|nr:16S rRNA processing protein RimM [Bacteroidales bacterium]
MEYFYLGLITKPFGYKGELTVFLDTDEPEKYTNLRAVFLLEGDEYIPYMIDSIELRGGNNAVVKFADVDGEEAKSLVKMEMYLPITELPPLTGNKFYYHEVIGFQVIDKIKGNIGICKDFIDISNQPIMQVDCDGKEILIPAVDDIFEEVDREKRILRVNAPEGLIDIYLEE